MTKPCILLISVMACDYEKTADGKQDGRTLGPHSLTRLRAGVALAQAQSRYLPVFVFSAGRLKPTHRRLCDLQAEYVRAAGFSPNSVFISPSEVWGSEAELRYATMIADSFHLSRVHLAVVTEDYHMYPRLDRLITDICDVALPHPVRRIAADSAASPPSFQERLHERLWLLKRCLPAGTQRWLKRRRKRRLAMHTQ